MGAFESYGSCAFPEIHNNETYMVFVDITTKFSKNINPNIRWGKFPHEKIFMEIFFVGFLIMKKVYIIWSHELIEKLDFYGLFYCYGVIFSCFS